MKLPSITLCLALLCAPAAFTAEVISETPDTTVGKAGGGMTGLMLGAIGGPIGAVAGAAVGYFGGGALQESAGLAEPAYLVETDEGDVQRFRAPGQRFAPGDQVEVRGIRLEPRAQ
ncbi:hypothetical protein [Metapseudomonas furukawaii]|uniref:Proteobacterial sortase system OmpA family protein n=1 Tax=Metapseudomonas furukawaii TaxID=1149133 RepID=A0AAD1C194_METFU|nr:hypothetical protein [Pseudomonas furukawaii]ELS25530.1 hypothetical protein ppKF707_3454 [Pseudomonas furukawaii]BAU74721.1 hypothetical protein KF707C_30330 [Pseudomonas furukawaii]